MDDHPLAMRRDEDAIHDAGWHPDLLDDGCYPGITQLGLLARITRTTMLEVLSQDFIRVCRAKGLSNGAVIARHALRPAPRAQFRYCRFPEIGFHLQRAWQMHNGSNICVGIIKDLIPKAHE
jgi:hypothetical protein